MRRLEQAGGGEELEALLARQAALIAALKRAEFRLRRELEEAPPPAVAAGGDDAVPAEFRELVDEYFRQLSRADAGPAPGAATN